MCVCVILFYISNEKAPAGKRKRERKVKEKAFPWSKNQKNLIGTRKNMLINLYMIKESEKPYCTVKEKLSRGANRSMRVLQTF